MFARPQQSQLVALQAANARRAILCPPNVDRRGVEVDLLPAKVNRLANSPRMQKGHVDQQPIPDWVHQLSVQSQ